MRAVEVQEARDVDAARSRRGGPTHLRSSLIGDHAGDCAGNMVHQIVTQDAARVAEAVARVQQQARRLEGRGTQHDDLGAGLAGRARRSVEVSHAVGQARVAVDGDVRDDGVGEDLAVAGFLRVDQRGPQAREVGVRDAALLAGAAVVAGRAAVVVPGDDRRAAHGDRVAELALDGPLEVALAAVHLHRRQKLAVGDLRQALRTSVDTDVLLHAGVVRGDLLVGDGPVLAVAVERGALEVVCGAKPPAQPAPSERAPAQHAASRPLERLVGRRCVGVADVVDEPMVVRLAAGVLHALDRPIAGDLGRSSRGIEARRAARAR